MDSDDPGYEPSKHSEGFRQGWELPGPPEDPKKKTQNEDLENEDPKTKTKKEDSKLRKRKPEDEAGISVPPKRRRLEGIVPHRGGEWQAILNNESGPPTVAQVLELLGDDIRDPREFFNNPKREEPGEFYGLNCLQQLFEEFPSFSKKYIGKVCIFS